MKKKHYWRRVGRLFLMVFLISISGIIEAQITKGGSSGHKFQKISSFPLVQLNTVKQNEINQIKNYSRPAKDQPFQFAIPIPVNFDLFNSGRWRILSDGSKIWQLAIESKGAYSLNLIFSSFKLNPGAELFLFNSDGTKVLGALTSLNNKVTGILATEPIPGDKIYLEYILPAGTPEGSLRIGQVGHDFIGIFGNKDLNDDRFGKSDSCNVDINCSEGSNWQKEKNAVVRILINGNELCTGVMMNNTNKDAAPYVLTAAHCITDSSDADKTIVVFGYESPYCDGPDGSISHSISGATLKATSDNLDFSLVRLSVFPPFYYHPYYAGWNLLSNVPSTTTCIHHPSGDVKKIAVDMDAPETSNYSTYDPGTFWKILQWDIGTTEPGSSGAPLFDNLKLVIGTLSGGDANCALSINDYFQKFQASWNHNPNQNAQLQHWLDPLDANPAFLEGFDPYEPALKTCDTALNYQPNEILILKQFIDGNVDSGYWTGHNSSRYTQYAEKIFNTSPKKLTGVFYHVGIVKYNEFTDSVQFKVWTGQTKPETLILSNTKALSFFKDSTTFFIEFDTIYEFSGNFWVGYEIQYDNPQTGPLTDQFSVFQVEPRSEVGGENTALFYKNIWTWFDANIPYSMRISLAIDPILCGEIPTLGIGPIPDISDRIRVRPNPADNHLFIDLPPKYIEPFYVRLYSLTGSLIMEQQFSGAIGTLTLDFPDLAPGIYFMQMYGTTFRAAKKVSIIH